MESSQIIEIALSDVLLEPLNLRLFSTANFAVDLRNIEDVDVNRARVEHPGLRGFFTPNATTALVIFARDQFRWIGRKLCYSLEYVFRGVRREVGDQFVVDGQIWRKNKKVTAQLLP